MKCSKCGHETSGKNRSNPQNKYYWGCVIKILSDDLGYTPNEMNEIIKHRFLTQTDILKGQKEPIYISHSKSTSQLDTKDFEELMTKVRQWASIELGIYIAEPNEDIYENNRRDY